MNPYFPFDVTFQKPTRPSLRAPPVGQAAIDRLVIRHRAIGTAKWRSNLRALRLLALLILWVVSTSGCGRKTEETPLPTQTAPSPSSAPKSFSVDPAQAGSISGQVLFSGAVPPQTELQMGGNPECSAFHSDKIYAGDVLVKDGLVQNAFVYVNEGLENYTFDTPTTPVMIDNLKCLYSPRVVGVQVNQPIELHNSDPTLHNIHSYPQKSAGWNLGLPFQGMKVVKKFSEPDVMVTLKCDVHPWMRGFIGVVPHPYYQVTGADGSFRFDNVPAGEYTLETWHERFGVQSAQVTVAPQESHETRFAFSEP